MIEVFGMIGGIFVVVMAVYYFGMKFMDKKEAAAAPAPAVVEAPAAEPAKVETPVDSEVK